MSRDARLRSETGIYHVMVRGNNKSTIFVVNEDYQRFIQIINQVKDIGGFDLYAYCLMDNHAHLLIKETTTMNISDIMKRINIRYAMWHNYKYRRVGHFFQGRFKSEPVENEAYYVNVLRYIHQNPLKAGLCQEIGDYEWSSYHLYRLQYNGFVVGLDNSINLGYWHEWADFDRFNKTVCNDKFLDIDQKTNYSDIALRMLIKDNYELDAVILTSKVKRDEVLALIKRDTRITNRQLSIVTGVAMNAVERATKK